MHTPEGFTSGHARPGPLPANTLAFAYRDDKILVGGTEDVPSVPHSLALNGLGLGGEHHYLGDLAGIACVAVALPPDAPEPAGWRYADLPKLFFRLPEPLLAIAARAFRGGMGPHPPLLRRAYASAKQGGARQGVPRVPSSLPARHAGDDGARHARPRLLLARAPRFPPGMYSACGLRRAGETIEDCIHREVREEVASASATSATSPANRGRSRIRS
jgi:hypothetical protein